MLKFQADLSEHFHLAIQFHLECTYVSLMYYDYKSAQEHLRKAQDLSGLDINMTGTCTYTSTVSPEAQRPKDRRDDDDGDGEGRASESQMRADTHMQIKGNWPL